MNDELEKSFEFILELEKLKAVQRRVKPIGLERYENSAEHSWQLSVAALVLAKFANEKIDVEKVIKMLIVHDIGEMLEQEALSSPPRAMAVDHIALADAPDELLHLVRPIDQAIVFHQVGRL